MSVGLCRVLRCGLFIGDCIETAGACRSGAVNFRRYFHKQGQYLPSNSEVMFIIYCLLQALLFRLLATLGHDNTLGTDDQGIPLVIEYSVRVLLYHAVGSPTFEGLPCNQGDGLRHQQAFGLLHPTPFFCNAHAGGE